MESSEDKKVVLIISISSDIGTALAERYSKKGHTIIGTYRSTDKINSLKKIPNCHLFYYDSTDETGIEDFMEEYKRTGLEWDTCILCPGTQKPVGKFFDCNFEEWNKSIKINALEPLHVLHKLYGFRNKEGISNIIFFAGAGTNNVVPSYSAYTASKIMLIKMCEIIGFENNDLNIFIIGPGITKTKMHYETLDAGREKAGLNYDKTAEFMESGEGTSMDDIFNCITWLSEQERDAISGRNFSVVWDKWSNDKLSDVLKSNPDMYKLRRFGNEIKIEE